MKVRLKDLGTIFTGNTPSKRVDEYWDNSDIKFIKPDIIKDELCVISSANEYISAGAKNASRIVPANSVLVTCIGNIGRVGITEEEVAFNQQINAIVPNRTIIPKYLAYAIYANRKQLQAIANAPVVPIINKTQFSDFEISICESLEKQNKIVRILDTISEIITHNKKKIEALDDLIKARFVEMFNGNYEEVGLSELGKISTGSTPSMKNKDFYENTDTPFYKPGDFIDGVSNIDCSESFIDARAESISKIMNPGTVAVTCIGIIGKIGIIKRRGICNQQINFITPNDNVNSTYLAYAIDTKKRFMQEKANAPVVPILNKTNFSKVTIPFAPVKLQNQFATFVAQVDKSKFALSNELAMGNFYIRLIHDCIMHGCINL